jgi:hypothetical protein
LASILFESGLPDGVFSDQKSQFGNILEGLEKDFFVANIFQIQPFHKGLAM